MHKLMQIRGIRSPQSIIKLLKVSSSGNVELGIIKKKEKNNSCLGRKS